MKRDMMKNTCKRMVAALVVATVPVLWSGCETTNRDEGTWPQRDVQTKHMEIAGTRDTQPTVTADAPAPAPAKPAPAPKGEWNSVAINMELVHLTKRVPTQAALGETYESHLIVQPIVDVADVVVTDMIPDGTSYVKSEPAAQADGKKLTWRMDTMSKGQTATIKLWLKAEKEGQLVNCATVHAIPHGCVATYVGKPVITIEKTGPATAKLGDNVTYTVVVRNTGSAPAKGVVVTDTVPDGLVAPNGQKSLAYDFGDLAPNDAKKVDVTLKADKRGQVCNVASAKGSNVGEVKDDACTTITQPGIDIAKSGTKEQFLGRNATYEIVVSNTGDTTLNNVTVTDTAPAATKIVSASGANVSGNTATWTLPELKAGEKKTLGISLTTMTPGNHCNGVAVKAQEGLSASSQACTMWKGVPAILIEVVDDPDPISVGDSTTYTIRVTNQGTADDNNIKIVARFDKEIDPTSASGVTAGTISGKTVSFAPVARLAPKQAVSWTISAKGAATGDHRLKVELTSDMLGSAVTEEESTHVY